MWSPMWVQENEKWGQRGQRWKRKGTVVRGSPEHRQAHRCVTWGVWVTGHLSLSEGSRLFQIKVCGPFLLAPRGPDFPKPFFILGGPLHLQHSPAKASRWQALKPHVRASPCWLCKCFPHSPPNPPFWVWANFPCGTQKSCQQDPWSTCPKWAFLVVCFGIWTRWECPCQLLFAFINCSSLESVF